MKVKGDEFFPADLVMVYSSGPKGVCYVETKGLDGETNLKHKNSPKITYSILEGEDDFSKLN